MKKTFILAMLLCVALNLVADDVPSITVALNDGGVQTFSIGNVKNIKYGNDNMILTLMSGDTYSVAVDDVATVSFSGLASRVTLTGDAKGGTCSIFSIDGTSVGVTESGHLDVVLKGLPRGTYIVHMGNKTIKITK